MKIILSAVLSAMILTASVCPVSVPSETDLLAAYIDGAAEDAGLGVMCAVGAVILNRCVYGGSIVSEGTALGITPSPSPSPMAYYAASLALDGLDVTDGAVIFFRSTDRELLDRYGRLVTYSVDGYCFARR